MTATKIGIWMDHQHALVTEFTTDPMKTKKIINDASTNDKRRLFEKGEEHMHTKEQHLQSEYYKRLSGVIKRYHEVILYGPTTAKVELFNRLSEDKSFSTIKIRMKETDKMTENQLHAFVRDYFSADPI